MNWSKVNRRETKEYLQTTKVIKFKRQILLLEHLSLSLEEDKILDRASSMVEKRQGVITPP